MFRTRSTRLPVLVFASLALATPAMACDPEDLAREFRSLCEVSHAGVKQAADALGASLKAEAKAEIIAKVEKASALCQDDRYDEGIKLAVEAARLLGNIEIRQGLPGIQSAQAPSATTLASAKP